MHPRRKEKKKKEATQLAFLVILLLGVLGLLVWLIPTGKNGPDDGTDTTGDTGGVTEETTSDTTQTRQGPRLEGRCKDADFRIAVAELVAKCQTECASGDGHNPMVGVEQQMFEDLFGQPDDAGVATHFAIFGCTSYSNGGRTCANTDAFKVKQGDFSRGSKGYKYAKVLRDELTAWVQSLPDKPKYLLLLGNASKIGNRGGPMSKDNQELAVNRARAVDKLITDDHHQNINPDNIYPVALDNEHANLYTAKMRPLIQQRIDSSKTDERGFAATGKNAVNRSVMVVAINCNLDAELQGN